MIRPSLSVFGFQEGSKHYVPHYKQVLNLYPKARLLALPSASVMTANEALKAIDYWNSDSDVFYAEDSIGFTSLMNSGGNALAYFGPFLKMYRIAHGFDDRTDVFKPIDANLNFILSIYQNLMVSDINWVSPVMEKVLATLLPKYFSKESVKRIRDKLLVLPPPGFYKINERQKLKDLSKGLVFLWNHRMVGSKNPKVFFNLIADIHKASPKLPLKIKVCTTASEKEVKAACPEILHPFLVYREFISDPIQYRKFIEDANITLGTSDRESFGISVFDAIKEGQLYVNLSVNKSFEVATNGHAQSFKAKEVPSIVAAAVADRKYALSLHKGNVEGLNTLPDLATAQHDFTRALVRAVKTKKAVNSPNIDKMLKACRNGATKRQLYQSIGWSTPKTCMNAHWAGYYYTLRMEGVKTKVVGGQLFYYTDTLDRADEKEPKVDKPEVTRKTKGLFTK